MDDSNFKIIKSPKQIKEELPLSDQDLEFIQDSRRQVCSILCNSDPRLLVILGPCSIHDEVSALEYASRIRAIQQRVKDHVLLVMRFYFENPDLKPDGKVFFTIPTLTAPMTLKKEFTSQEE